MARGLPLVDRESARRAVQYVEALFQRAVGTHDFGESGAAHLVIMHPLSGPGDKTFEEAILYEQSFGDRSKWDVDYAMYARAKAEVAWRTGRDTQTLAQSAPQLLKGGDTLLGGGICIDGMVAAVSGMHPWYDEALAASALWFMRALAKERAAQSKAFVE